MSTNRARDVLAQTAARGPRAADLVLRARAIHAMDRERNVWRSVAIRDGLIVATARDRNGLDDLISDGTRVLELLDLTVIPAFIDTHEHMLEAARNLSLVPVDEARSIAELVNLIRLRAATTPPGQWIETSIGWNESNLAEGRLPTAGELDRATREHPVLARRGGHTAVANTLALRKAKLGTGRPEPAAGTIEQSGNGGLSGIIEGGAVYRVRNLIPPPSTLQDADALARVSRSYAALGVGTIREAQLERGEFLAYQSAWEQDALAVRARPMLLVDSGASLEERMSYIEGLGMRSGFGDDRLRVWGLKFVLDGGVAGAALNDPYADEPTNRGDLNWDPDELYSVMSVAVRTGWKVADPRRRRSQRQHATRCL